jgi:drug/metabolite transporter (DMT)-like permease
MSRARGYLLVAMAASSWGTWSLFFRAAERLGPFAAELEALVVMTTMALVTLPFALREGRGRVRSGKEWALLAAMGVTDALNILLFFRAMRLGTVSVAVLSHSIAPVLVAASAPFVLGEPTRGKTWLGAALALLGLVVVLAPWRGASPATLACAAAGAGSAVFYAANVLMQKRLGASFSPSEVISYHSFPSAGLLALAVPAGGFAVRADQLGIVGVAALGPGALAGLAFVTALRTVPASHAAVIALLEPLVAVMVSAVVWGERLGPSGVVGAMAVLAGVWLTTRA